MSGPNAARTLPPGDRDDAPSFDLGPALQDMPLVEDAPPAGPTHHPDIVLRVADAMRHLNEAHHHLDEALIAFALRNEADMRAAFARCDFHASKAATRSRLLADPPLLRARKE